MAAISSINELHIPYDDIRNVGHFSMVKAGHDVRHICYPLLVSVQIKSSVP